MTERDDNPDAPASDEEQANAEALRQALADPSRTHAGADFARSVALAHAPPSLSPQAHRAILERSMVRGELQRTEREERARQRRRFLRRSVPALALAAAVALFVASRSRAPSPEAAVPPMTHARSTAPLFDAPFARLGGESARLDRIAAARASDLRDNRFASWGLR